MAVTATQSNPNPPHQAKFAVGANVVLTIVIAAALLVAVNWFCSLKNVRRNIAELGSYGLSERTKSVLDENKGDIELSMIYMPDEENEKQSGYIRRVQDYLEELQRYSTRVKVTIVETDSQREKLVARISQTFGGEASKHKEALEAFNKLETELKAELTQRVDESRQLMEGTTWIGDFPIFANIATTLKADRDALNKAAQEIKELTPAGGIPKYSDATNKAKTTLSELKTHLEAVAKRLRELALLSDETTRPDSKNMAMLREVAAQARGLIAQLRSTVGQEGTSKDAAAALKAFADKSTEVGNGLEVLVQRVDGFAKAYPMVRQHPSWAAQVQMGPLVTRMEVADVLQQAGGTLGKSRLVILGAIDSKDPSQITEALASARNNVEILEKNAEVCERLLTELADGLSKLDPGSKTLLDAARGNTLFADRLKSIDELDKKITSLPELKLGSIADQLKEDNIVVAETAGKIRVVTFNEMWPARESVAGPSSKGEELGRSFAGDSSLSSALLAMTRDKPFATVLLVGYEPPPPQQRNQFMPPPPSSWIPMNQLSELRKRLEAVNFKTLDWNMATTPEEPKGEDGIPKVYVFLPPPPPTPPNPFQQQARPEPGFGEKERQKVQALLAGGANALFLSTWEVRSGGMFGGPLMTPPYPYNSILEKDWGIKVDNQRRITWLEPDRRSDDTFNVVIQRFGHMPAAGFTDNPVGSPLRGTRFLVNDACPVDIEKNAPAGVTVAPILQMPERETYVAAEVSRLVQIIDQLQNPNSAGVVRIPKPRDHGPFTLVVSAERKEGDKSKGRVAVSGIGACIRDEYLNQPVMAMTQTLRLDPPPTENLDLIVNALYWLNGEPQWISRGPVPVPRVLPIPAAQMKLTRLFVWGIWPALVFAPGLVLWTLRRR